MVSTPGKLTKYIVTCIPEGRDRYSSTLYVKTVDEVLDNLMRIVNVTTVEALGNVDILEERGRDSDGVISYGIAFSQYKAEGGLRQTRSEQAPASKTEQTTAQTEVTNTYPSYSVVKEAA